MFIKLYKVNTRQTPNGEQYYLTEVTINVNKITFMSENFKMKSNLNEGKMNLDLNSDVDFTDLRLSGKEEITVIGNPSLIESKIQQSSNKTLLRG